MHLNKKKEFGGLTKSMSFQRRQALECLSCPIDLEMLSLEGRTSNHETHNADKHDGIALPAPTRLVVNLEMGNLESVADSGFEVLDVYGHDRKWRFHRQGQSNLIRCNHY